jgi:hypothetical protein
MNQFRRNYEPADGRLDYAAFWILPLRMQDVQTRTRFAAPFTTALTDWRFKFQRRLVTLWAWLIRWPNCGPRPHTSQTRAIAEIS